MKHPNGKRKARRHPVLPEGVQLEDLLPHRDGMLLVGDVIELREDKTVSKSVVAAHWPMTDQRGAQVLVLVELAAQTAGINNGWQNRLRHGPDADTRGWIVGVKSARFDVDVLPLGAEIRVTSENSFEFDGFREIRSTAEVDGRPAAQITLQLMQAEPE
jgi:predicted hotdog family 3-hydroxylacyl-ACP dehydratase